MIASRPGGRPPPSAAACRLRSRPCAPIGTWQPPPRAPSTARSAMHRRAGFRRDRAGGRCARRRPASSRVSIASAPWPTAGHIDIDGQDFGDALLPAQALQPGRGQHNRIVLPFGQLPQPRIQIAAQRLHRRSGPQRQQLRGAPQRTGPHLARPRRDSRARLPDQGIARVLAQPAPRRCPDPAGSSVGRSFMLCTARSTSPVSSASSISFVNSPLEPTFASGTSVILSPVVLMISMRQACPSSSRRRLHPARLPQRQLRAAGSNGQHHSSSRKMRRINSIGRHPVRLGRPACRSSAMGPCAILAMIPRVSASTAPPPAAASADRAGARMRSISARAQLLQLLLQAARWWAPPRAP